MVASTSEQFPIVLLLLFVRLANNLFAPPLLQPCLRKSRTLALIQLLPPTKALTCVARLLVRLRRIIYLCLLIPLAQASHLIKNGSPVDLNVNRSVLEPMFRIVQTRIMSPRDCPILVAHLIPKKMKIVPLFCLP